MEIVMASILIEQSTVTSKGQVTLPKSIRQALGIETGSKLIFTQQQSGEVVLTTEAVQNDPAITAFLQLIENDIRQGKNIGNLPDKLVSVMLKESELSIGSECEIDGDVEI
jgi:antitoxin PrlF